MFEFVDFITGVFAGAFVGILGAALCCAGRSDDMLRDALDLINRLRAEKEVLMRLIRGEWVDCEAVQNAMEIDFNAAWKIFDFSRTAEWNPEPLNGQKITTKFRLKTLTRETDNLNTEARDG